MLKSEDHGFKNEDTSSVSYLGNKRQSEAAKPSPGILKIGQDSQRRKATEKNTLADNSLAVSSDESIVLGHKKDTNAMQFTSELDTNRKVFFSRFEQ